MTREEQILEYANSFKGKGMESDELKEIIRLAIIDGAKWADNHPMKPSLPSNLDDAAEEYEHNLGLFEHINLWPITAFKAGAEWMAGQFVWVGGEPTGWFRANDGSEYATGLDLKEPIKIPVDFYVRKK